MTVADQHTRGYSVVVSSVTVPEANGKGGAVLRTYVALARNVGNEPHQILGYATVPGHNAKNVTITLRRRLTSGRYYVLLYSSSTPPKTVGSPLATRAVQLTVG